MDLKISHRHIRVTDHLENLIERQAKKIRRLLPTFADHDLHLNLQMERLSTGKQYHAVLVLSLPQKVIRVEDIETNLTAAVVRAFNELTRRIKRFKSRLNREQYWHREKMPPPVVSAPGGEESLEQSIAENLDRVENFIRREIFHQVLLQGLPPGILQPHAVVDEVFLEIRRNPESKPESATPEQWFYQVARRILADQIEELEASKDQPHVEEAVTGHRGVLNDEEMLAFYQPDEELKLEDLLRDEKAATPEEYLAEEETEDRLQEAIARLPKEQREIFILFVLEGFNSDEVAMMTGRSSAQVLASVERSREELREALQGSRAVRKKA